MYTKIIQRGVLLAMAVVIVAGMAVVAQAQVGFPSRSAQVFDKGSFTTGSKLLDSAGKEILAVKTDGIAKSLIARGEEVKFTWNATGKIGGSITPLPYCMNSFNNSNAVSSTEGVSGYFNAVTDIRMVCIGLGGGVSLRRQVTLGNIDLTIPSVSVSGTRAPKSPDGTESPQGTFLVSQNLPVTVTGNVKNIGEAPLRNYDVEVVFYYSLSKNDPLGTAIDVVTFKTIDKGGTVPVQMPWVPPSTLFGKDKDVYVKACILENNTGPLFYEQSNENDCSKWSDPFHFISS